VPLPPNLRAPRTAAFALLLAGLGACSDARPIAIEVTPGKEEGALLLEPAVTEVTILAASVDGTAVSAAVAAPGEDFDLGEFNDTAIVNFDLTGVDADGNVVARGRSVPIAVGTIDRGVLPLFIQRTGGFARPPGDLARAHLPAPAGVLAERFIVTTGGDRAIGSDGDLDPAFGDSFDMLRFAAGDSGATLPRAAKSLVLVGTALLLIGDDGGSFYDLDSLTESDVEAPEGLTFADVAGGLAIESESAAAFVVGATRPDAPSTGVLVVDANGGFSAASLATPRAGAAAAWVPGIGLAVAGGSASGAGVEVVGEDLSVKSLAFPSDEVTGAAMVLIGEQQVALIGGRDAMGMPAATRVLDLQCVTECGTSPGTQIVTGAAVPELAARGQAYAMSTGAILAVGEAEDGETLAFRVSIVDQTVTSLPLRDPRRGATPVPTPNGTHLALIGGERTTGGAATSLELFFPE
jgi:hypothetical protein